MTPRVSIAMSVLDAERTLAAAIASVRLQTFDDWELLLADDGSTDASLAVAEEAAAGDARVKVIASGERAGVATRLNELVEVAAAPLIARMDADDIAYPQRIERQLQLLDARPEVDLTGSSMLVFGAGGAAIGTRRAPLDHAAICRRPTSGFKLFHPTWMGRTEWFRRHRYDPGAIRCEDQDLLRRAHRQSVYANVAEPLLGYREERLILRAILSGRRHYTARAARALWSERAAGGAVALIAEQAGKAAVDAIAMGTGLDHRLLRQRAGPARPEELAEWRDVWLSVAGSPAASAR